MEREVGWCYPLFCVCFIRLCVVFPFLLVLCSLGMLQYSGTCRCSFIFLSGDSHCLFHAFHPLTISWQYITIDLSLIHLFVAFSGDIVVADTENHRIQIFSDNGNFKSKFGTKGCKIDQVGRGLIFRAEH